jgi:fibronectin type 3 domain-containing protein
MRKIILSLVFIIILVGVVLSQQKKIPALTQMATEPKRTSLIQDYAICFGFNMKLWMSNRGCSGINALGDGQGGCNGLGLEYPTGSDIEHLYGGGLWIGAITDTGRDNQRVVGVTVTYEGWSGALFEMYGNPDGSDSFFVTSIEQRNGANRKAYDDDGDGFVDEDEYDGIDNDDDGLTDEDYGALAHSDAYVAYTDTYRVVTNHVPLGIKVWQKSYSWRTGTSGDAILIFDYTIVNVGQKRLDSVYVAYFADADVGPANVPVFYLRNYAAYNASTRTAYVFNPKDHPSSPIGFSVLHAPKPLDSLRFTFQWFPGEQTPSTDVSKYNFMSLGLIKPDQYPTGSDTRILLSVGPFDVINPGDTLHYIIGIVSGSDVSDMLNNAERAKRIYGDGGFIMPVAYVNDLGDGNNIQVSWSQVERSPYDTVTSYRVYYGTSPGLYTDSVTTTNLSVQIGGLTQGQIYYFTAAAIDNSGHRSALADEMVVAPLVVPRAPEEVTVTSREIIISIYWRDNIETDLEGYNVYRYTSEDTALVKVTSSLLTVPVYEDFDVWGDRTYYYKITAIDHDGNESDFSTLVSGHLIPPNAPKRPLIAPSKTSVRLLWTPNIETDLAGYNLYRSTDSLNGFLKVNTTLILTPDYTDETVEQGMMYYYRVEAMDTTDAVSDWSRRIWARTVPMNQHVLVVNYSRADVRHERALYYRELFEDFPVSFYDSLFQLADTFSVFRLGNYSSVIWLQDLGLSGVLGFPVAAAEYILGGGKLMVMNLQYPHYVIPYDWHSFLRNTFGVDSTYSSSPRYYDGARGFNGYPNVEVDSLKRRTPYWQSGRIEYFPRIPSEQVIYRGIANPLDTTVENQPVGIRTANPDIHAIYCGFPLYYMKFEDGKELMTKVLADWGEISLGVKENQSLPMEFRLEQAYPNPFNPVTIISYQLKEKGWVTLRVYDILGQEVTTLVGEQKDAGKHEVKWDAEGFSSGVYFYRITVVGQDGSLSYSDVKKMLFIR